MANETFEVYSLTSKLDLDTSAFDRAYNQARPKVVTLSQEIKRLETGGKALSGSINSGLRPAFSGLQTAVTGLGGPLDNTIGRYSNLLAVGSKLSLSTAGIGLGFGILATGATAAAVGIFTLVKRAADAGDEIFDLTQKINFAAETVSTLKNEGELAGVEFQAISASLGIFNKNVEAAQEGNKKLANLFKVLKIDLTDNETALRATFKALLAVEDGGQQTALAMQIFGKSGKEVLGIIKSMNGDVDAATEKFRQMGSLITTEAATAANDFSDKLTILEQKFDGVTRAVGERFMPTVSDALDAVSAAMDRNSHHAQTWADDVIAAVEFMAQQVKYILEGLAVVMEGFRKTFGEGSFFGDMVKGETMPRMLSIGGGKVKNLRTGEVFSVDEKGNIIGGAGYQDLGISMGGDSGEYAIAGGPGQYSIGAGPGGAKKKGGRISFGGGGGGGGGSDPAQVAQRVARLQLEATLNGLKAEQDANQRALTLRRREFNEYATQYMVIENRRHKAVLEGLDAEQRAAEKLKKGKEIALLEIQNKRTEENTTHEKNRNEVLDQRGRILDKIETFLRDQDRTITSLTNSTTQWDDAYQQLVDTLKEEGVTLEENTRKRVEANIQRAKELELILSVTRARRVADSTRERFVTKEGRERPPWIDLGGGSTVGGEPASTERPRVVTPEEQVRRERAAILREQMDSIAYDLTYTIDSAITEGFRRGVKAGVIEFGLGILQMARSAALRELEAAISRALGGSGGQGQSGTGGIFSTLIRGISGIFGGSSTGGLGSVVAGGTLGKFATGGYIAPDSWALVGERGPELIKAGSRGASVFSHGESMAMAGGFTMNVYANDVQSFASRRTQTQIKRGLMKMQRGI